MNKILRSLHDVLLNAVNDSESNNDRELYTLLRQEVFQKLEAEDIPDFIFGCDNLNEFKKFISTLYLVKSQQTKYIDEIFIELYKKHNSVKSISRTINDTLNNTNAIAAESRNKTPLGKFLKFSLAFISLVATLATIYGAYLQVKSSYPSIEINRLSTSHLTIPPRIKGLKVNYYYRDTAVADLWKTDLVIKNIGNETIIAVGSKRNILPEKGLLLQVAQGYKILDIDNRHGSLPASVHELNDTTILIKFEQWRKSESIRINLYLESTKFFKSPPSIYLNERQIIDGRVNYLSYESNTPNNKVYLVDYLPSFVSTPLKLSLISIYGLLSLILPIGAVIEINKKKKGEKIATIAAFIISFIIVFGPLLWIINKFW